MKLTNSLSDDAVLTEVGRRMAATRIERHMTQAQLAEAAGVSKRTVERLEDGASTQLSNLIRCLRALDRLEGIERRLPEMPANPIELLKRSGASRTRARAPKASPLHPPTGVGRRKVTTVAEVKLWGRRIGAVSLEDGAETVAFAYDPPFIGSGVQVAPLTMPLGPGVFSFPDLPDRSFHGLPGLLADSRPDTYGNTLIDAWLATQGRTPESFNAVERLCYTGVRGMGALEFAPAKGPRRKTASRVDIDALVKLASELLTHRGDLLSSFADGKRAHALREILRVGTSAGGARAKAVIAWNAQTNEVRSGQVEAGDGFDYWLLKFDGVTGNKDKELADPRGYGVVEYAYALMTAAAGIDVAECRLLEEGGRRHFMTKRFDRLAGGGKLHMQSLAAMAHLDLNNQYANSYEQALFTMRRIGLPMAALEEQFRRMIFNVLARNQDDHVKDIAFLMDRTGTWSLSPAFDITWAYNPAGEWTSKHQISINGKRDDFTFADFEACAKTASIARGHVRAIVEEVREAVSQWPRFAAEAGVEPDWRSTIDRTLRLGVARA
jgi:serine/threonine-protein kinase HipA